MREEVKISMVREILEIIFNFIKSRVFIAFVIFAGLFAILVSRVFSLQIVNSENYVMQYTQKMEKKVYYNATRGNIYDADGNLLAYNKAVYSVVMEDMLDSSKYKSDQLNEIISKTIDLIEKYDDSIIEDFALEYKNSTFVWSDTISDRTRLRFLKDIFGTETLDTEEQKLSESTPLEAFEFLAGEKKYDIDVELYGEKKALQIAIIRYNLSLNAYQKYISTTIAKNVSEETVGAIYESSNVIPGVTISEDTQRIYDNSLYFAHIIGYTGKISDEQLTDLNEQISDSNTKYELNDIVGKIGIEASMELTLNGTKGYEKIIVDNLGRVLSVVEENKATAGNDIYLTIKSDLQIGIYHLIEQKLAQILCQKIVNRSLSQKDIDDWLIPIKDVYFQIINNNVVDSSKFNDNDASDNEKQVYAELNNRKTSALSTIVSVLNSSENQPLSALSAEMNEYYTYIFNLLSDSSYDVNLIPKDSINTDDSIYKKWMKDEISLREILLYAIDENWIDTSLLNNETNYIDRETIYNLLVEYINNYLQNDEKFNKLVYKYLIENGTLTGGQICRLLYDQEVLDFDANAYAKLSSGTLSSYDFIMSQIKELKVTPAMLALDLCSASVTLVEPNTGNVIAMVSYPSYDNNAFSGSINYGEWTKLSQDSSSPLYSRATKMRTAPGSTFKPVSAIAGLESGVITPGESIYTSGIFEAITPSPKCWIYPGRHGSINVTKAIEVSCNCFFYEVGYRMARLQTGSYNETSGLELLKKYGSMVGLTSKSGVEVEEYEPLFSTKNVVTSAIGQGSHSFTGVQLARYVNTLASNGTNYELTLIKDVVDLNGTSKELPEKSVEKIDVADSTITAAQQGMKQAGNSYGGLRSLGMQLASKSGTAQENLNSPDHALNIAYAPFDNPEISVSVIIQNGYTSSYSINLTGDVLNFYFGNVTLEQILAGNADGPAKEPAQN